MDILPKAKVDNAGAKTDYSFDKWKADKIKAGKWVGSAEADAKFAKPKTPPTSSYTPR